MSDDIPDAVEHPPWRPSDGPEPTVLVYPHRQRPTLQVRYRGAWLTGEVYGRQDWANGAVIYQINFLAEMGSSIIRAYRWPQPGLRLPAAVRPGSDDGPMTISMQNYALTWTEPDGTRRASAVAYDKTTAEQRKTELSKTVDDVEIVPVKPGELPEV